jgi:hypothetical protein
MPPVDNRVEYSGHSGLFVDGKELGRVWSVAICQQLNSGGEDHWNER